MNRHLGVVNGILNTRKSKHCFTQLTHLKPLNSNQWQSSKGQCTGRLELLTHKRYVIQEKYLTTKNLLNLWLELLGNG